jgi:CRP-like cAMP-binding protein
MEIPFRRQEIAEMSGLTIETAIRSVRKLEKRGYLKIINRKIVLENLEPLKKLLES